MDLEKLKAARRAFSNICRGYSVVLFGGDKVFLKHLSHHDQVDFDFVYDKYYKIAQSKNVPTEKERIKYLIEDEGSWSTQDEVWLEDQDKYIKSLTEGKKLCILPKQVERQNELIKQATDEYNKKIRNKNRIIGMTCEVYADRRLNEYYVLESFFADKDFSTKYFDSSTLGQGDGDEEMNKIVHCYNEEMEHLNESSVKWTALQDFVQMYWGICEDSVYDFFGIPICNLTYQQIRLINYAKIFREIIIHNKDIPEDVRKDPDKLLDYANASDNVKKQMDKTKGDAKTLLGAKKEDYQKLGMDTGVTFMSDELKKSGTKTLNMQDLMKIIG